MKRLERFLDLSVHRLMLIATIVIWTIAVSASFVWNIYHTKKTTIELAANEAVVHFQKDMAFGRWGAKYGGVYIPVTDDVVPSRFLSQIPERDIVTPSGKKLTLMNPAYMLKKFLDENGLVPRNFSSITSLRPINPDNSPDPWQKASLMSFESGLPESFTIEEFMGKRCVRYMRPVITEKGCLKCHEAQGYREGDIRGGISVSVPLYNYQGIAEEEIGRFYYTHGFIWLLGMAGVFRGWAGIRRHNKEKMIAYRALEQSERQTRYLNSQIINAHETERKRIAKEVHDEIGQIIIATKFIIENAIDKVKKNTFEGVEKHLNDAVYIIQKAIERVRSLEKNLLPPLLKDLGLKAAVLSFCRDFEKDYPDISVKAEVVLAEDEPSQDLKVTIFRIIQETFSYIARHSGADTVNLELVNIKEIIKLNISDNGRGFDPGSIYDEQSPLKGLGFASVRERTEFSGGRFQIRSGPGTGTVMTCEW